MEVLFLSLARLNKLFLQADGTWTDIPRCVEHEPGVEEQVSASLVGGVLTSAPRSPASAQESPATAPQDSSMVAAGGHRRACLRPLCFLLP